MSLTQSHRGVSTSVPPGDVAGDCTDLDDWCSQIPELVRTGPSRWGVATVAAVSYPDEAHAQYAALEAGSYWFEHRNAAILATFARFPPAGRLLDVGGGNGFVSLGLQRAGWSAVVIEPGPGAATASDRGLPVIQASFDDLSIPEASVDAVGLFDVLEHLPDDLAALTGIRAALRPGGRLYLTVPTHPWLWSGEDEHAGHHRRYRSEALNDLLRRAGFAIDYHGALFASLVPAVFLLRAAPTRLGLRRHRSAARTTDEHRLPDNPLGRSMRASLAWERDRIARGDVVPFGTSAIVAARRPGPGT